MADEALHTQLSGLAKAVTSIDSGIRSNMEHLFYARRGLGAIEEYTRPIGSIRALLVLVWLTQLATLAWLVYRG